MSNDDLTPEEREALLAGEPAADSAPEAPVQEEAGGIRGYDLASQERVVRGRLPALESVNGQFVRNFRTGFFNLLGRACEISAGPVKIQKFSAFTAGIPAPSNINVMNVRPLRGAGLLVCDPSLVFTVIDNLFGGNGRLASIDGREFSATEQRIILRMVEVFSESYAKAWAPVHPVRLEYARSEMHPEFAAIASPSETVVSTTFRIGIGEAGGDIHLCIPYAAFEPIRDTLTTPPQGDLPAPDARWVGLLKQQIQFAEVELAAELAHSEATVRELMALKAGDFIELDRLPTVVASVDGVPVFECEYGSLGAHYGIRIKEFLTNTGTAATAAAR